MQRLITAFLAVLALALAGAPAALARPSHGPCRPGDPSSPKCLIWNAKVDFVADGDTIDVDIAGDGSSRTYRVRIASYNAPELGVYSSKASKRRNRKGSCRGVQAADTLERAIRKSHWHVRLAALHAYSRSGSSRLRRSVQVKVGGRWVDNGPDMLRRGLAVWLPNQSETAWNKEYSAIAQEAAAKRVGLWSTTSCGAGPEAGANLRLRVKWDADGNDHQNVNGEWIDVINRDATSPVNVGGWNVRVSDLRHLILPSSATIPAGGRIRIHMGRGTPHDNDYYFGSSHAFFGPEGEGAYLFDPQGDPRAWMIYPCRYQCTDPLIGAIKLGASPIGRDEYVTVKNVSGGDADLEGYILDLPYHEYEFGSNSTLAPGETLRMDIQGNPDNNTRLRRFFGFKGPMLTDSGQIVRLQTYNDIEIACTAWGKFNC
jgi:endonuclease YncB( thermonuclease family)